MKTMKMNLKSETAWLILLLITNIFFIFVIWLTAPKASESIIVMIVLFTAAIVLLGYIISHRKQKNQIDVLEAFLSNLDEDTEALLLTQVDKSWHPIIEMASAQMREQTQLIKNKQMELKNYQEFIEAWTHEIKTPLSLATLVLDNHKDAMSPYVYKRMEHVRYTINGNIEKILYYARLHADHVDYKFERINLRAWIQECLDDFRAISDEKGIDLQVNVLPIQIVSDKNVLTFIMAQLLSNALKYTASEKGIVHVETWIDAQEDKKIHLAIRDNGKGVPKEDLPFLFDKGFTGNHSNRQHATGMGLYLLKKYADALAIEVRVGECSTSGKGFEIELIFPSVA